MLIGAAVAWLRDALRHMDVEHGWLRALKSRNCMLQCRAAPEEISPRPETHTGTQLAAVVDISRACRSRVEVCMEKCVIVVNSCATMQQNDDSN